MSENKLGLVGTYKSSRLTVRAIDARDIENLRSWKNRRRNGFFHTAFINDEQQRGWFDGYVSRARDYMFVVNVQGVDIGCMGIRYLDDGWDVYNVILGRDEYGGKGYMAEALSLILKLAYSSAPTAIRLKVLKDNPAFNWYQKNGFAVSGEGPDYYVMHYARKASTTG